jgi:glycosyltransferase involved in cell wall biosynthesis
LIENFPNTCLEAMSVGQVVVVTRETGFDQLVRHGDSGWMCRADDPDNLLAAVERALSMNEAERLRMGLAAKKRIMELNPERVAAAHLAFYRKVTISQGKRMAELKKDQTTSG